LIPGAVPGIKHDEISALSGGQEAAQIVCIDYSPTTVFIQDIDALGSFLTRHRPEWSAVRWIKVEGLAGAMLLFFRKRSWL
jgi:magnesium transporter